jgi:hypothetical protein
MKRLPILVLVILLALGVWVFYPSLTDQESSPEKVSPVVRPTKVHYQIILQDLLRSQELRKLLSSENCQRPNEQVFCQKLNTGENRVRVVELEKHIVFLIDGKHYLARAQKQIPYAKSASVKELRRMLRPWWNLCLLYFFEELIQKDINFSAIPPKLLVFALFDFRINPDGEIWTISATQAQGLEAMRNDWNKLQKQFKSIDGAKDLSFTAPYYMNY